MQTQILTALSIPIAYSQNDHERTINETTYGKMSTKLQQLEKKTRNETP